MLVNSSGCVEVVKAETAPVEETVLSAPGMPVWCNSLSIPGAAAAAGATISNSSVPLPPGPVFMPLAAALLECSCGVMPFAAAWMTD